MNYYTWCFAVPVPKDQPIDMPKQFEMVTMFRSLSMKDKQRFLTWIDECVDRDIVKTEEQAKQACQEHYENMIREHLIEVT